MTDPDQYDRFTRGECDQKHDGKCIDVIYGWKKKEGKEVSEVQALRYSIKVWTEADARNHCKQRGGSFEAAKKSDKGGNKDMDNIVTQESFQVAYPDLYKQITDKATAEGFKDGFEKGKIEGSEQERARIKGVEDQLIPGHEGLIASLKFDGKTTGPEAAVKILNAEKAIRSSIKTDLEKDTVKPLAQPPVSVESEGVDPNLPVEERTKQTWDKSPAIREEFLGNYASYLAWMKQSEAGNVRILKKERSKGGKE